MNDLSRLESDIGIVCERRRCTRQAVYIVHVHAIDHCNVPKLDVHGDRIFALCPACTKLFGQDVLEQLDDLGVALRCKTCGRRVARLHDVYDMEWIRSSESLVRK